MSYFPDEDFIEDLYGTYYQILRMYCYAFVRGQTQFSEDIEECIQDVFYTAYCKREKLYTHENLEAWLKEACKRRMKKVLSKAKGKRCKTKIVSVETLSPDIHSLAQNIVERWDEQEEARIQVNLIETNFSKEERTLLKMYWQNGASLQEIAMLLNTTLGTAKNKLHRLKKKAKKLVEEKYFKTKC